MIRGQEKVSSRSEGIVGRTAEVGYLKWCLSVAPLEAESRLRVTDTQHSIFFCLYGLLWRPAHGGRRSPQSVTDGPFAETKEQLGGFFLIDARDLNEAIQVALRWPSARLGSIEVRPIEEELRQDRRYG